MGDNTGKGSYVKKHTDACREKIRTTQLINRLQRHINGKLDLSPTQVRGIEILLNKTLANLQQAEIKADVATYVARLPTPAVDNDAWLASVKPLLVTSALPSDSQPIDIVDVSDDSKSLTDGDADDYQPD